MHRGLAEEVRFDRQDVSASYLRVPGKRECRIQVLPIAPNPVVQCPVKLIVRPSPDPRLPVGCDIRNRELTEWSRQIQSASERAPARCRVARLTVAGQRKIATCFDLAWRGCKHRSLRPE